MKLKMKTAFGIFTILATVSNVIDACPRQIEGSGKLPNSIQKTSKTTRNVATPITVGESGYGLLLRPRSTKVMPKESEAEEIFGKIDANDNDMIDAAEWVDFSEKTSVWDFVKLLDFADVDGDETVSLKEFLRVQIVKINSVNDKDDDAVTSS